MTTQDKFMEKYLCDVMNENEKFFNRKKQTLEFTFFNAALSYRFTFIFTL